MATLLTEIHDPNGVKTNFNLSLSSIKSGRFPISNGIAKIYYATLLVWINKLNV